MSEMLAFTRLPLLHFRLKLYLPKLLE